MEKIIGTKRRRGSSADDATNNNSTEEFPTTPTNAATPTGAGVNRVIPREFCAYWPRNGKLVVVKNGDVAKNDDQYVYTIFDGLMLMRYWDGVRRLETPTTRRTDPSAVPTQSYLNPLFPIPSFEFDKAEAEKVRNKVLNSDEGLGEIQSVLKTVTDPQGGFLCTTTPSTEPIGIAQGNTVFSSPVRCYVWPPTSPIDEVTTIVPYTIHDSVGNVYHLFYETMALLGLWDMRDMTSCEELPDSDDEDEDGDGFVDRMEMDDDTTSPPPVDTPTGAPTYGRINPLLLSATTTFHDDNMETTMAMAERNISANKPDAIVKTALVKTAVHMAMTELDTLMRRVIAWYYTGSTDTRKELSISPNMGPDQLETYNAIGDTILVCAHNILHRLEKHHRPDGTPDPLVIYDGDDKNLKRALYYMVSAYRVALANVETLEALLGLRSMYDEARKISIAIIRRLPSHMTFSWNPDNRDYERYMADILNVLEWKNPCSVVEGYAQTPSVFADAASS